MEASSAEEDNSALPPAPAPAPAPAPPPAWPPAVNAPPVTATNPRGITVVMPNVLVAPAVRGQVNLGPPPPPAGTPRAVWDRQRPAATTADNWATTQFVHLPPAAWFTPRSQGNPVAVPGLPPWTGQQPLSTRERCWALAPVLRSIPFCGFGSPDQLAIRAQLREALLVTRAGARPPVGEECNACRDTSASLAFSVCISGGQGQKCNNCLFRGHRSCSFE